MIFEVTIWPPIVIFQPAEYCPLYQSRNHRCSPVSKAKESKFRIEMAQPAQRLVLAT